MTLQLRFFTLIVFLPLFLYGCITRDHIDQNASSLLDSAKVIFDGQPINNEFCEKTIVLGQNELLVLGQRIFHANGQTSSITGLISKWDKNAEITWAKELFQEDQKYQPRDAIHSGGGVITVLVDHEYKNNDEDIVEHILYNFKSSGDSLTSMKLAPPFTNERSTGTKQIFILGDNQYSILMYYKKPNDENMYSALVHYDKNGKVESVNYNLDVTEIIKVNNNKYVGFNQAKSGRMPTKNIICFDSKENIMWDASEWVSQINARCIGVAEDNKGMLLLSSFDWENYRPVISKIDSEGKLLWTKRPKEMKGYVTYNIINWGDSEFMLAAQKSLFTKDKPKEMWESLAAFIIDDESNILDSDIYPKYWSMIIGGVSKIGRKSCIFTGVGSKSKDEYIKQFDIALYYVKEPSKP